MNSKWAICCGMIRSGSTLQYQVVSDIYESFGLGTRLGYFNKDSFLHLYSETPRPKHSHVIKLHDYSSEIKQLLECGRAIGFYTYRDIRDVATSSMRKFNMSFKELMIKGWLNHAIQTGERWLSCNNVLVTRYEDLVINPSVEYQRYAKHIGIDLSHLDIKKLLDAYSLSSQRDRIINLNASYNNTDLGISYDTHSLLHHNHIHKGEIGGWRTSLNKDQIDILTDNFGDWLIEHGYMS